jgi:biopolymer transport protein ExbD
MEPMHDEHVNVTPLIDVIMCLIIFFLLVGRLTAKEFNDKVVIPKAHNGQPMTDQEGRLVINVAEPPDAADGTDVIRSVQAMPTIQVRDKTFTMEESQELTRYLRNEKAETPNIKIVLRADEKIPYKWIAPVMVACIQADIKSVNFSTAQETASGK